LNYVAQNKLTYINLDLSILIELFIAAESLLEIDDSHETNKSLTSFLTIRVVQQLDAVVLDLNTLEKRSYLLVRGSGGKVLDADNRV
jgi:hypothetical protein